jgi:dinuclear metal center YbgI/SA1388 family protein
MHPKDLIARIETTAPLHLAASWDKSGVQIASAATEVKTLCVALDPTVDTLRRAVDLQADFLLCHHPLALSPRLPSRLDEYHEVLRLTLGSSMWLYSAHTSLDANPDGPVNWLGRALGLRNMRILEVTRRETPILFRVPASQAAALTDFESDRSRRDGDMAEYTLWPEAAADFRSRAAGLEGCQEIALTAPAREFGFGCIGTLPQALTWPDFSARLHEVLRTSPRSVGFAPDSVTTVAYCPGSGADLGPAAFARGADVYLTGDVKYHQAQAVQDLGRTRAVGHCCLEETMMRVWSESLAHELDASGVRVVFLPGRDPFA